MLHMNPFPFPLPVPLYITPDQFLPLTSALGAIMGILLMFWTRIKALAHRAVHFFTKKGAGSTSASQGD